MRKFFSFLGNLGFTKRIDANTSTSSSSEEKSDIETHTTIFNPSLHIQRHRKIIEYLQELKPSKVVDFGCSRLELVNRIRQEPYVRDLYAVDIDKPLLESQVEKFRPKAFDYIQPRINPLNLTVFHGSIADKDSRLKDVDVVVCVELIEHLYPDTLEKTPENIFGYIRPKHAIITTPNFEYNVIFNNKPVRFRHWDHKFEWTRDQFENWCNHICMCYGYKVRFDGVGEPTKKHRNVGFCSQFGVFERLSEVKVNLCEEKLCYDIVTEIEYPHRKIENIVQQILSAVECFLWRHDYSVGDVDNESAALQFSKLAHIKSRTFSRALAFTYPKLKLKKASYEVGYQQFSDACDGSLHQGDGDCEKNIYGQAVQPVRVFPDKHGPESIAMKILENNEKAQSETPKDDQFSDACDDDNDDRYPPCEKTWPEFPCLKTAEVLINSSLTVDLCLTRICVISMEWPQRDNNLAITDGVRLFLSYHLLYHLKNFAYFSVQSNNQLGELLREVFESRAVQYNRYGVIFDLKKPETNSHSSSSWRSDFNFGHENFELHSNTQDDVTKENDDVINWDNDVTEELWE